MCAEKIFDCEILPSLTMHRPVIILIRASLGPEGCRHGKGRQKVFGVPYRFPPKKNLANTMGMLIVDTLPNPGCHALRASQMNETTTPEEEMRK